MATKEKIRGAILIYSCEKHKHTRLKEFGPSKKEYNGWKVFIVMGNRYLETEYQLDDNILTVKVEDSYLHIFKKVVKGIQSILDIYDIEEGVLRCGDDLIFHDDALRTFLRMPKQDYMGMLGGDPYTQTPKKYDTWVVDYYKGHPEDFNNPSHGLPPYGEVMKMTEIPVVYPVGHGVMTYISKRCCEGILRHVDSIQWNTTMRDETYGYPYILEDVGIAFILRQSGYTLTPYPFYTEKQGEFKTGRFVTFHTNKYKN